MPFVRLLFHLLPMLIASVALAADCQRTFAGPLRYGIGQVVHEVAATDFDSDGRPDIAAGVPEGVALLLNQADGFIRTAGVPLPGAAHRLYMGDVNGDGRKDLIIQGPTFIATAFANGNATFRTVITTTGGEELVAKASALGDFNGDGHGDLAAGVRRGEAAYLRIFQGAPDGTFSEPFPARAVNRELWGLAAGELTGDARVDLAYADLASGGILPGNGGGTFGPQVQYSYGGTMGVQTGDFDRDGQTDLLAGSSLFLTSRGFGSPTYPVFWGSRPQAADVDEDGRLDLLSGSMVYEGVNDGTFLPVPAAGPVGPSPAGSQALADFDMDGKLDIASGTPSGDVVVRHGLGNGRFDGGNTYSAGFTVRSVVTGDLDGNGRTDIVTSGGAGMFVHLSDGSGTIRQTDRFGTPMPPAVLGDFNGDGKLDAFLGECGLAIGKGNGKFSEPGYHPNTVVTHAAAGDLNGDGKLDVVASTEWGTISRLLGDGKGGFSEEVTEFPELEVVRVALADFNGDSRMDIAATTTTDAVHRLYIIDGTAPDLPVMIAEGVSPFDLLATDVDGDSRPDLVAFAEATDDLLFFSGNDNGTFGTPEPIAVDEGEAGAAAAADFTGDGRIDFVVTRGKSYNAQLLEQQADGSFVETARIPNGGHYGVTTGDFDADGFPDIVLRAERDSLMFVHLNRCRSDLRTVEPRVELAVSGRTLSARVPSDAGGTMMFYQRRRSENPSSELLLATVPVVNGTASTTIHSPSGQYVFRAVYSGQKRYARSEAAPLTLTLGEARRRRVRH